MGQNIDPSLVAKSFRDQIRNEVRSLPAPLHLVGLLAEDAASPSVTYAEYTQKGCEDVGIAFDLRKTSRFRIEAEIGEINRNPDVHGVIIYYPIFEIEQDNYIKDLVAPEKDIEGLGTYWLRRLYENVRFTDQRHTQKAILPCTPLAIVKLLEAAGGTNAELTQPLLGKTVSIFNRSEVVGRPLASMLANDGARVYSFDVHGAITLQNGEAQASNLTRPDALAQSDIVITGVPSRKFDLVTAEEIRDDTICINFSTLKNFTEEAKDKAGVFVPRVGPMTVTMALRNTLRLFHNYHG